MAKKKQISVSQQLKAADDLGAKVAKIMNDARAKANKLLLKSGHGVNINVDFYKIEEKETIKDNEVLNG